MHPKIRGYLLVPPQSGGVLISTPLKMGGTKFSTPPDCGGTNKYPLILGCTKVSIPLDYLRFSPAFYGVSIIGTTYKYRIIARLFNYSFNNFGQ